LSPGETQAIRPVNDVILAGGGASLFGLKEYFAKRLNKNVQMSNPFSAFVYPAVLRRRLEELGSSFAVAAGVAMTALEI